jgi:hypothetical protein
MPGSSLTKNEAGLPDGSLSYQKSQFGCILEGLWMENVGIPVFMTIRSGHFLWKLGIACGHLAYFSRFGMFGPTRIWQPWNEEGKTSERNVISTHFRRNGTLRQGDQIGRFFTQLLIVYILWTVFWDYRGRTNFGLLFLRIRFCINFDKNWVGLYFWAISSHTPMATLRLGIEWWWF